MSALVRVSCVTEPSFGENAYVVDLGDAGPCWLIDPGLPPSAKQMLELVAKRRLTPDAIVLTHAHADHIAGIPEVMAAFPNLPIYLSREEQPALTNPQMNLSAWSGIPITIKVSGLRDLEPPGPIRLGPSSWDVLDVAGHSPGGRALYSAVAGVVIVGDALFEGSIGRTDFPTSDHHALIRNIHENLFRLPDETVVYSGHGGPTTIGEEKRTNPFLT